MYHPEKYHLTDEDGNSIPIITLEVLSESSTDHVQHQYTETEIVPTDAISDAKGGAHFFIEKQEETPKTEEREESKETPKARTDLLEYMMRNDGSVVCKLCGEILQSRTHWYRHKYKLHVVPPLNPAPLFQCEQCLVYFKSRKGYIGHLASRHSEILSDTSPVLTNSQVEASANESTTQPTHTTHYSVLAQSEAEEKEHQDPEMSIPKTTMPNYQTKTVVKQAPTKSTEVKKVSRVSKVSEPATTTNSSDWVEKRSREEKLVAEIIDRVRRECEAQGSGGPTRRGYSRRYTVMHT